ncbi:unnamed protein product [Paramecium sonneborni]|uniref:Protein kinase domain-containing protein n=1 Tax=Paramecium sonneborni TaxID=65129 RepID=A0A8S1LJA7_9CILI|nr:unnamed protein product [Paramecium sonneborni]
MSKEVIQKLQRFRYVSESLNQFDLFDQKEFAVSQISQFSQECYDAFQKAYSQDVVLSIKKISEDNKERIILNKDTGVKIDYRNQENLTVPILDQKEGAWKNYWKQSRKISEQLLQFVQQNKKDKVLKLLGHSNIYIDFNIKDLDDWTPLHFACQQSNLELVQLLLEQEGNPKMLSLDRKSPLHISSIKNDPKICELLINSGANIDEQDSDLNTPLHIASRYGNDKVCQILLEKHANHQSKNNQNLTPIELASDINIIQVFDKYGISLNTFTYSRTVIKELNLILQNSRRDHVEKLLKLTKQQAIKLLSNAEEFLDNDKQRISIITDNYQSTQNQFVDSSVSFYRISLKGNNFNTSQEIKQNKIGPQSFQFYQKLGEGGFGEVYLVEKIGQIPKKQYAMKILKKQDMNTSNIIKSAQIEKDVLKMMNHPFIVKLNWAFQTIDHLYLVMDLCSGGDLATHLSLLNSYSENTVKIFAAEITLALEALHSQGIIFRDLKPDNIVLDANGHALLTDFGLSKSGIDEEILNQSFCGTLAYLAPEMLMKKGHGRQVDWYMLGILIYELLVGAPPYYDSEKEILKENIKRAPLRIPKSLSQEAKDIIIKLLIRNPKKRLGSKEDAKEIKSHSWFCDINWQDCFHKKLKPPKPLFKHEPQEPRKITFSKNSTKNKLEDWTFFEN